MRLGRPVRPARDLALVDLDTFFVSVERARDPRLRGRPVIVGGQPHDRGVVACASYEARAFGARAGMPLHQAAALCPRDTVFLDGDHAAYRAASQAVLEVLGRFTPLVEALSPDEALLDLTGCERHHRSWLDAGRRIHDDVRETVGLPISVGIGRTKAVAKIAATLAKPDGVLEVRRGEEAAFLADLPLERLPGVGPHLRRELARFNLHTAGDLALVDEATLVETFGRTGVGLARRARGLDAPEDEIPVGEGPAAVRSPTISRETSFAQDTCDDRFVDGMLACLGQRATRALRAQGRLARAVRVRLRYADFRTVDVRRRLPRPTDRDEEVLALARRLWRERYDRRVRLRLVGIALLDLVPATDRQLDLFDLVRPARPTTPTPRPRTYDLARRLDEAVDRVRDRHGFGALLRGRAIDLLPTHRPHHPTLVGHLRPASPRKGRPTRAR